MIFNGQEITLKKNMSVSEFLQREGYNVDRVAVEKNGNIVSRNLFDTEILSDSDKVEIVHFVGGG